jgi:uncharacterized delta-60 repeat protein
VAGYTSVNRAIAIARFNPDGSLDDTFDGVGKRMLDTAGDDRAYAVLAQPDHKIVIAGVVDPGASLAVMRLNPDGSADTSFDGDGTSAVDFGRNDEGYAAALQSNGKIVVAGYTDVTGQDMFAVARLQPGGALDTTFSFDGRTTLNFGGDDTANAVALQPDGRIMVGGHTTGDRAGAIARLEGDAPPSGGSGGPGGAVGGSVAPRCAGRRATIVGTAGRDALRGTRRADVIVALGGNDRIRAERGNDRVCGGAGNDLVTGRAGRDRVLGGRGNDRLAGGGGRDSLLGQAGRDALFGGPGSDRLSGGGGRDNCLGGPGPDSTSCENDRGR